MSSHFTVVLCSFAHYIANFTATAFRWSVLPFSTLKGLLDWRFFLSLLLIALSPQDTMVFQSCITFDFMRWLEEIFTNQCRLILFINNQITIPKKWFTFSLLFYSLTVHAKGFESRYMNNFYVDGSRIKLVLTFLASGLLFKWVLTLGF